MAWSLPVFKTPRCLGLAVVTSFWSGRPEEVQPIRPCRDSQLGAEGNGPGTCRSYSSPEVQGPTADTPVDEVGSEPRGPR